MKYHLISVYTRAGVLAHVQSTNGDQWPPNVVETDSNGVVTPLVRIDVEVEPTAREIANSANSRLVPRSAAVLFTKELEVVAGKVRYRAGEGAGGAIVSRAVAELIA